MFRLVGLVGLLFVTPVVAQQSTPMEQALSGKLIAEINGGLQCVSSNILQQQQIEKLQQKIKELEIKLPPAPEAGEAK